MEAHGSPLAKAAIGAVGVLPDVVAKPLTDKFAIDRLAALQAAMKSVRRGGTVSVSGVYGGEVDPLPMMEMFDRGITIRMGQCHVRRWTDDILAVLEQDDDVLGLETLATHRLPLEEAPAAYEMFQKKADGCVKVVLQPVTGGPPDRPAVVLVTGASSGIGRASRARGGPGRRPRGAGWPATSPTLRGRRGAECLAAGAASALVTPVDVGDDDAVGAASSQAAVERDRPARRRGQRGRSRRLRPHRGRAGRGLRRRAAHQPAGLGEPGPPRAAGAARHRARARWCSSARSRPHRRPGDERVRPEQVGRPGPGPPAGAGEPRPARCPRLCVAPGGVDTPIYRQAANYSGLRAARRRPWPRPTTSLAASAARRPTRDPGRRSGQPTHLIRSGFTATPFLYDALVGPLFAVAALDRTGTGPAGTGQRARVEPGRQPDEGRQPGAVVGSPGT